MKLQKITNAISMAFVGSVMAFFLFATLAFLTGCDDMAPVTKPIVDEVVGGDEPMEPSVNGEVKQPEESEKPATPEEEPTDTTPPTVIEIAWYSDEQLTTTVENIVHPGDTVYAVITFSEAAVPEVSYTVDDTNLPADSVESLDENQNRFVCRYTIPANAVGTIALQVGGATADLAGNTVTEVTEYIAPFVAVDEPAEEPSEPPIVDPIEVTLVEVGSEYTFTLEGETYPGYNPSPKLQRILDTHPSTQLPHFAEAVKMIEVVSWAYRKSWELYYPNNLEKMGAVRRAVKRQFGLTKKIDDTLFGMYFDFLGGDPESRYWFTVECFRLLMQYPEELQLSLLRRRV